MFLAKAIMNLVLNPVNPQIPKVLNLLVWGCIVIMIIILAVGKSVKAPDSSEWQVWLMREFLKLFCNPSLTNIINKNNTVSGREMKEANDILCCNFCFRPSFYSSQGMIFPSTPVLSYFLSHFSLSPWTALPQHLTLNDPTYESNYLFRLYF